MLGKQEMDMNFTEQFRELLYEFYHVGISDKEISVKEYIEEIAEKLESYILQNA
ncbi:hypothetical protein ACFYKT_08820 [Cytobacillus sp. FJAT-53684]|uniref:Sporulation protein Spo0E n=1 Tax=Cytobacillus mangrovibacter TaxID=3299024 RepID=A0ABW6K0B1_9BACI